MAGPSDIVPYIQPDYLDALDAIRLNENISSSEIIAAMNNMGLDPKNIEDIALYVKNELGFSLKPVYRVDNTLVGFYTESSAGVGNAVTTELATINSNTKLAQYNIRTPVETRIVQSGGNDVIQFSTGATKVSTGAKILSVLGDVNAAIAAASVGISLGKTIDSALYNLNPDFWDANGMASLNPDTWGSITNGSDAGILGDIFNFVFGIDPNTGKTQAYLDENAYAYLAQWLASQGIFASASTATVTSNDFVNIQNPATIGAYMTWKEPRYDVNGTDVLFARGDVRTILTRINNSEMAYSYYVAARSLTSGLQRVVFGHHTRMRYNGDILNDNDIYTTLSFSNYYNGYYYAWVGGNTSESRTEDPTYTNTTIVNGNNITLMDAVSLFGSSTDGGIEGIGNQDDATLPTNTGTWTDPQTTLNDLKNQYPDLWDEAVTIDSVQPDGTVKTNTYVPVPMPSWTNETKTQPISSTTSQLQPDVSPDTDPQTKTQTTDTLITPEPPIPQPDPTGSGDTPQTIIPTGTANALYAIYNPSQAEVNSLGAWLWSPDFVDQLLKLFNDPMQAIIGLHKVYATPSIGGRQNIKVGYLDSGVSSNVVNSQYVTVDCGTVSLPEYFGNVFDYAPYTDVSIYLPFIGIHRLDVADVMRSTIGVVYHVDVLTGACLAEININRDASGGVLYTFSGNCAVQYPLSSGSYMGIISTVASVATSAIGGFATGGIGGAALGAGLAAIHGSGTRISHSGSLSGNSGAMGGKIPYLIISRPQTTLASTFPNQQGYPTNYSAKLGDYSGFVQCRALHVDGVAATDSELNEIRDYLASGVIV